MSPDHEQDSKVVCLACWNTINAFHTFQNDILQAHEDFQISIQEIAKQAEEEVNIEINADEELIRKYKKNVSSTKDAVRLNKQSEIKKPEERSNLSNTQKNQCSEEEEQSQETDDLSNNEIDDKSSNIDKDAIISKWIPELECVLCSATAKSFGLLRTHFRNEHPNEKYYIICCERRFSKRCDVYEHIQLHLDPDVFKCNICGKCSTNSRNLAKHVRDLHTEEGKKRPFECSICHKHFQNKTKLRTHMEVHESGRDHICSECGKGFPSENRRRTHERMVHNVDRICEHCGITVHGIYALKQHLLLEHEGVKKPKWPCDQCDVQLHSHSSLKRHKQLRHHDGTTAYICSDCGKVFPSQSAIHSHKRLVHIMERRHKCEICQKAFKFPKSLREHLATHTGIDLYQCPHCPRTFKVSANMHHHRKKDHPKEWLEGRTNKNSLSKFNISLAIKEIVI